MPSLSRFGRWGLVGGVGLTLGGIVGAFEPLLGAGNGLLLGLALAWVAAVPLPRRMRRERLEFTWWIGARGENASRPNERVPIKIALRNPTDEELVLGMPRLALSPGLRHTRARGVRVIVPPRAVASFELEVSASYAGQHVLHGAWMTLAGPFGLVWAPLYFPNPLVMRVQPRGIGNTRLPSPSARPEPAARSGRSTRRAGEGPEVRELREHQPGDPFRRIAWKASARRGKLLVRETEDEAQTSRVLVVDGSATMRGDEKGAAKLDYAIELVAQAARLSAAGGDRLGFVGFVSRVVHNIPPAHGASHLGKLVNAAIDFRVIVDEDLTDVDDDTLVQTVARYFREQEGVELLRGLRADDARRRLAEHCLRSVRVDPEVRKPFFAKDPVGRVLRAFCRSRALPLPLRHDSSGTARLAGITAGLRAATEGARESRTVLLVSDLETLSDLPALKHAIAFARQKRHRVTIVAPAGEDFVRQPTPEERERGDEAQKHAIRRVFLDEESSRLKELRGALAGLNVPIFSARAVDPVARWLRRAAAPHARTT